MDKCEDSVKKELFLDKFERLSLRIEQLTEEITKLKDEIKGTNKFSRTFGLEAINNSEELSFSKDIFGLSSPSKKYLFSIRLVVKNWHGQKDNFLLLIRQKDQITGEDVKVLGIRIPIRETRTIHMLAREILSLLYISCEINGIEI
ncbi:MAG: hypothetical protein ACTSUL_00540, partial [Promethearchaeota archaeon]